MHPEKCQPAFPHRLALRPKEAAHAIGVSERTFRALLPEIPQIRAGGCLLIPIDLLREWLRSRAQPSEDVVGQIVRETFDKIRGSTPQRRSKHEQPIR